MSLKWIRLPKLAEESGYSVKALERKIEQGVFVEGVHYRYAPDGRIHFLREAYEAWVEGDIRASRSTAGPSASVSSTRDAAVGSR